jgi:hypothetical protein
MLQLFKKFNGSIKWFLIALLIPTVISFAQTGEKETKEKINNIKGHVEEITITAGGSEFTFSGDEAAEIFEKLKSAYDDKVLVKLLKDKGHNEKMVWVTKGDGDVNMTAVLEDEFEFNFEDEGADGEKIKKEIKIDMDDGEKKVTVKTTKDGEVTTDVYEGEEAEEFLKKSKHNKKFNIKVFDDGDLEWVDGDDVQMIFLSEEMEGEGEIEKKIEVSDEDGVKKVTVTTTKDGKEDVKTYEGDEAEEYLEKMNKGNHHKFKFFSGDDDVIIIDKDKLKIDGEDGDKIIEVIIDKDDDVKEVQKIIIKKEKNKTKKKDK